MEQPRVTISEEALKYLIRKGGVVTVDIKVHHTSGG